MSAIPMPTEEEIRVCNACGLHPRAPGTRSTWCRACKTEWQRNYRAGVRLLQRVPPPVRDVNGCLIWQGAKSEKGYGQLTFTGECTYAHRVAWEREHGPIPDGLTVDHTCLHTSCVEVAHMQLVTRGRNTQLAWERRRSA
jgi:hypothetical protein